MSSATETHRPRPGRAAPPPFSPAERHLAVAGTGLLLLWTVAVVMVPQFAPSLGLERLDHAPSLFADGRTLWGLPNAMDVISNLPFLLGGVWGLWCLWIQRLRGPAANAAAVFFAGLVATAVGSSVFHLAPGDVGLILDRAGMAVAFAGALGLAAAERVGARAAHPVLAVTLVLALLSAVMPVSHGNVVPWGVVQFGGMALMLGMASLKPVETAMGVRIGALLAWYALAKGFELLDNELFHLSRELVSGHTLKHLVAALAAWPVIQALRQNARAKGGRPADGSPRIQH